MARPVAGGGREDCWSEGATASLVEAWGDRYLLLNRGNLRQKDWSDVANAVNARQELLGRPRKTDVQCKNRIDTVKKKYKSERSKSGPSTWAFFDKLDFLVGSDGGSKSSLDLRLPALTFPVRRRNPNPNNRNSSPNLGGFSGGGSSLKLRMFRSTLDLSESSRGGYENDEEDREMDEEGDDAEDQQRDGRLKKRKRDELVGCGGRGGMGDLARTILKFAEVYERVEIEKQKQVMEMERQRMEFAKEVEFQRMKLFMEAQLEVEKMKQPKHSS